MSSMRVREIFNDLGIMLIVIEAVDCQHGLTDNGCRLYGSIEPIALIVCKEDAIYALDMDSKPVDYEKLRAELPELDTMVVPSLV